jgi:hypothetical protein
MSWLSLFQPILFGMLSSLDTNRYAIAKSWQEVSSDFVPHGRETSTLRMRISMQCSPFFTFMGEIGIKNTLFSISGVWK